ncbi:MAG: 23S rRNA (guanosine(2251)-2'-O)-methyltransferase RlmB [Candidatus Dadabacteria bacterium]|nr:23S rRNA (guanosine(2251)-2'-O)-methyltransferase RlmB [Candidatus Dadabacteria bacterium]NIQ13790.1 23S rRNA (guanosine(2251)-2'-O)-methyltransferase RlmB [Candidatus Dadabacteria bacterium]
MIIYGKNAVFEYINNEPGEINEIILSDNSRLINNPEIKNIKETRGIKISTQSRDQLSELCNSNNHQGIVARVNDFKYSNISDVFNIASERNQKLFLLILDHIEDPHNLGAIIRTAEFLGVHGVFIPKDRACDINPTVVKTSSGAVRNISIVRVTNLSRLIEDLKKKGIWIVGAEGKSKTRLYENDLSDLDIAVVIGNEGKGIQKKVKEKCDYLFSIPKRGKIDSLNASVASGIFLYELSRQR